MGGQSPTRQRQRPTAGRGGTKDDQEEEQFPPRPPPRGNVGGGDGGDGNDGGGEMMMMEMMMMMKVMMMMGTRMTKILKQSLKVKMGKNKMHQEEEVVEVMNHHLIRGVEMWDLEVKGDIEVKEDGGVGQVHRVYQVHRDHRDLRALRV